MVLQFTQSSLQWKLRYLNVLHRFDMGLHPLNVSHTHPIRNVSLDRDLKQNGYMIHVMPDFGWGLNHDFGWGFNLDFGWGSYGDPMVIIWGDCIGDCIGDCMGIVLGIVWGLYWGL